MKHIYITGTAVLLFFATASDTVAQQCFDCGTGSDGSYVVTINDSIQGGTYNFTDFTIDTGITLSVWGTTPLMIYCQGAVNIQGTLTVSGDVGTDGITFVTFGVGGTGAAGGNDGGDGIYVGGPSPGFIGSGPGPGTGGATWSGGGGGAYGTNGLNSGGGGGFGGTAYGDAPLSTVYGGSGGGGGSGGNSCGSGGGGAGGGIVVIFSCDTITVGASGLLLSNGGNGGSDGTGNCGGGGAGGGGSIWLATTGILDHNGSISALGGVGGLSDVPGSPWFGTGADGGEGRIRLDYATMTGGGTVLPAVGFIGLALTDSISALSPQCALGNDGEATVTASGGATPYTYLWDANAGNQTTAMATGLAAGIYYVTVTDDSLCTVVDSATVIDPALIVPNLTSNPANPPNCDGDASAAPSGGIPPYSYQWDANANNQTTSTATALCAGTYYVTVTDDSSCAVVDSILVGPAVGIFVFGASESLLVYPNPNSGKFRLQVIATGKFNVSVNLVNHLGQTLTKTSYTNIQESLNEDFDLSAYPKGIYHLIVQTSYGRTVKKILIL